VIKIRTQTLAAVDGTGQHIDNPYFDYKKLSRQPNSGAKGMMEVALYRMMSGVSSAQEIGLNVHTSKNKKWIEQLCYENGILPASAVYSSFESPEKIAKSPHMSITIDVPFGYFVVHDVVTNGASTKTVITIDRDVAKSDDK
jgi:hypothetical protein